MKKQTRNIVTIIAIIGLIFSVCLMLYPIFKNNNETVGGQTDIHGCLYPAGYSWNESLGFCLREWELNESERAAAQITVDSLDYYVTIINVEIARCPGCFSVQVQRNDNRSLSTFELFNWKIVSTNESQSSCKNYTADNCPSSCAVCPPCEMCSSLSCNTKDFCNFLGFNETWYDSTANKKTYCTSEQKNAEVCTMEYAPVCGWFNSSIKCLKYPCAQTYSNLCEACSAENVEYYTNGECPLK